MFAHFGIKDFIDVLLVAFLLYYLFRLVKISGLRPLFIGILVFMVDPGVAGFQHGVAGIHP